MRNKNKDMAHNSSDPPVPRSSEKSEGNLMCFIHTHTHTDTHTPTIEPQLTLCSSLTALITDDLTDAIICAKKIVKETEGMNYW